MPIEGFPQALEYNTTGQRLWAHLIKGGANSTPKTATTPTITIYQPNGASLLAATDLTQSGSTAWWYKDLNLSSLAWAKGLDYRALTTWTTSDDLTNHINTRFDVVTSAFNEPLVASGDVDLMRPAWAGIRPSGWTDWSEPIKAAHRELMWSLRRVTVERIPVRPAMLLNRDELYELEMTLTLRNCADAISRLEEERKKYNENANFAMAGYLSGPFAYDSNDDQVIDENEAQTPIASTVFSR